MYYSTVGATMFGLPLLSILLDGAATSDQPLLMLIGKWYLFWAVGARLLLAGGHQVIRPQYTAQEIFATTTSEPLVFIRELGFANVSLGTVGLLSLGFPGWRVPVAIATGIFFGLAGANHLLQQDRKAHEVVAMVSDLFAAVLLLGFGLAAGIAR